MANDGIGRPCGPHVLGQATTTDEAGRWRAPDEVQRRRRVDALRRAIDRGAYAVDPRVVARAILEFEDRLLD